MTFIKSTKLNFDLIRNLPPAMKTDLIVFEEVIPDGIMSPLYDNVPFYKKERHNFLKLSSGYS